MKTKIASGAASIRAKAGSAKGALATDIDDNADVLQLDRDEAVGATTLTSVEKARRIQAAKAANEDDDDDDMDVEEDDAALVEDDDSIDDDELDKEFAEFDLPKSNRGGKKAGDDDVDEEFRDLGLDTGGGGFDDDDDDF
jgi:DNA-directed RNA polymerase subunit delta